jgi:hypothetical protein
MEVVNAKNCFGSCVNVHFNQDEPNCRNCSGSGVSAMSGNRPSCSLG